MATRMQQRRGTAAQWTAANPTLAAGEIGFETDTNQFKMGDGANAWSALSYFKNLEDLGGSLDDYVPVALVGEPDGVATLNANGHIPISQLGSLITNAPGVLDTLGEIAQFVTAVDTAVDTHEAKTLNVHGIADTAQLETLTGAQTKATAAQSAATLAASNALDTHNLDTTSVHGIADTSVLATQTNISTAITAHNDDTTNVHGIADTAALATTSATASAISTAVSNHTAVTTNVHGIADTAALATKTYADGAVSTAVAALTKSSVGLANVDNTADASKPISTATQTALDLKAPLASPTFTGTVEGITKSMVGLANVDNTADSAKPVSTAQATAIATAKSEAIADATSQVNALLTGAPAALNTLDELAAALGDDANFASTVTTNLAAKAPLASPTFTGTVTVAAEGVAFTDGTQTKAGVPSITNIPTAIAAGAHALAAGRADQFIPLTGAVVITLPATGYSTGQSIDFYQESGTGASFASTNSVVGTPGRNFRTTNSVVTAMKTASGWLVFGDLSA